jgi:hypothetical protein
LPCVSVTFSRNIGILHSTFPARLQLSARNAPARIVPLCFDRESPEAAVDGCPRMTAPPSPSIVQAAAPPPASGALPEGKIHRVDPDFESTLTASNRYSQSNCWVNWKIMGQPCEFQVPGRRASSPRPRTPPRRPQPRPRPRPRPRQRQTRAVLSLWASSSTAILCKTERGEAEWPRSPSRHRPRPPSRRPRPRRPSSRTAARSAARAARCPARPAI